ncbi:MAG: type II toxin-antitoxin system VapB family antitoxin [Fulvivirga sp.]
MRTTLDIPADLMKKAMQITGSKTKSQAIKDALEALVASEKRKKLLLYKGKIDLNIDLDLLRDRK